jgi:hypothetical protein
MNEKLKGALITGAAVAALAGGGAAIAGASGGGSSGSGDSTGASPTPAAPATAHEATDDQGGQDDGNGTPVAGSELDRASAAALKATGGGTVTGSELRDEEGYYEIEVARPDGTQVDVHLDQNLNVIDASADGGGEG